jgi:hypothetical protein
MSTTGVAAALHPVRLPDWIILDNFWLGKTTYAPSQICSELVAIFNYFLVGNGYIVSLF